jgi:serine O-acetyltransferase
VLPDSTSIATPATITPCPSASEPDWSREAKRWLEWVPSRSLLASLRSYEYWRDSRWPWSPLMRKWSVMRHRFWSVVTGADIPLGSRIGGGLMLPHPNGIVIHPHAEIGPNCLIFQQVTIGAARGGVPKIAGHVDMGAGAKLLGPIHVGAHARIGANVLVIDDVPAGARVVAEAAKIQVPV